MLSALREQGRRVVGTERSVESARPARENGLPVFVGDLSALRQDARFDLIVLFHVLEHLEDPCAALAACAAHLTPTGRIVIAVPNLASWQARVFGPWWFHLDAPRHLVHFSPRALDRAFATIGLQRVRTSFASAEHDPYGWVQSALDRLGFPQNALTRGLMGMNGGSLLVFVVMAVVSVPVLALGTLLSLATWWAGSGAIMEVWAARAEMATELDMPGASSLGQPGEDPVKVAQIATGQPLHLDALGERPEEIARVGGALSPRGTMFHPYALASLGLVASGAATWAALRSGSGRSSSDRRRR